jgi:hypothetical protein
VVQIDHIPGKKGAVVFMHEEHAARRHRPDGAKIVCKDCHHTLAGNEPAAGQDVKPCRACHVPPGQTANTIGDKVAPLLAVEKNPGKIDTKSILMHKTCVDGCHKPLSKTHPNKKIATCRNCHPKAP